MNKAQIVKHLTVGKFQRIRHIEDQNEVSKGAKILSILTDTDLEVIRDMEIEAFRKTLTSYQALNFREYENKRPEFISAGGNEYRIISNPAEMSAGQFIDLHETRRTGGDDPIEYMDRTIAILMVKGKKYDSTSITERQKLAQEIPLLEIWGLFVFFFNLWIRYTDVTEDYLYSQMQKTTKLAKEILHK